VSKWRARALDLFPDMRTDIQSAESVGRLWIELILRLERHYSADPYAATKDPPNLFRATCLYATWCKGSDSPETREAAAINFYFQLPRFALQRPASFYKRFIQELIANLPLMEIEMMGGSLQPSDMKRFLADVRQAEDERRQRSRKR
jgi:hypothetical protein